MSSKILPASIIYPHLPNFGGTVSNDDLPPGLQKLIGQECSCGEDCPPDPRVSCQYTGNMRTVKSAYVQNARKGDLILCPGTAGGVIGGLLHALTPAQHYSHMGIFVKDQTIVRHSCGIQERSSAPEYYSDTVFGQPVPLNGLDPEKLRYAWPGTVTQTVYQAYRADRARNVKGDKLQECDLPDTESAAQPPTTHNIDALSFDPVFDASVDKTKFAGGNGFPAGTVFPLVVKPCSLFESTVRSFLHDVADHAGKIFCHYRFFAYSQANIALDPTYFWLSPKWRSANPDPLLAFPDSKDPLFPDPNDRTQQTVAVPRTVPTVCSSFVWLAVQSRNADRAQQGGRQICLDLSSISDFDDPPPGTLGCQSEVQPEWSGDDDSSKVDGLYHYGNTERQSAAQELFDNVSQSVANTMQQKIPGPVLALISAVDPALLVAALVAGVGYVAVLLGIDIATAWDVTQALQKVPERVANQLVNAFASDYCETSAATSDNWKHPGSKNPDPPGEVTLSDGYAVGPDNIVWFWDPPTVIAQNDAIGVYGYNERAIVRVGSVTRPICQWARAGDPATVTGTVMYHGTPIAGAVVSICCETETSKGDRGFSLVVPAGRYYATAAYTLKMSDGTVWGLDGGVDTGQLQPGVNNPIQIQLQDPPPEKRMILVTGHADLTDVQVFKDDWASKQFNLAPMYAEYDLQTGSYISAGYAIDDENEGDSHVRVEVWIDNVKADKSVDGHFTVSMPDEHNLSTSNNFTIAEDGQQSWHADLDSGGLYGDRVHVEFSVANNRAP